MSCVQETYMSPCRGIFTEPLHQILQGTVITKKKAWKEHEFLAPILQVRLFYLS